MEFNWERQLLTPQTPYQQVGGGGEAHQAVHHVRVQHGLYPRPSSRPSIRLQRCTRPRPWPCQEPPKEGPPLRLLLWPLLWLRQLCSGVGDGFMEEVSGRGLP